MSAAEKGFTKLGEELIHQGHVISMVTAAFRAPDGSEYDREVVHHPGAVAVVPMLDDRTAILVRQYRPPLDQELLEIPAGKRDVPGEPPEVTAQRELEEEIGYRAGRLDKLAMIHNSPGFCDEEGHLFLGRDLIPTAMARAGVEEQYMTVEHVDLGSVDAMIADGRLTDAKTIVALLLARQQLC